MRSSADNLLCLKRFAEQIRTEQNFPSCQPRPELSASASGCARDCRLHDLTCVCVYALLVPPAGGGKLSASSASYTGDLVPGRSQPPLGNTPPNTYCHYFLLLSFVRYVIFFSPFRWIASLFIDLPIHSPFVVCSEICCMVHRKGGL